MNYYRVSKTSRASVIGSEYPQIIGLINNKDVRDLDNLSVLKGNLIDAIPHSSYLELDNKAKWTDVLSCSLGIGIDYIVSPIVLEILSKFSVSDHQKIKVTVNKQSESRDYWWIHFIFNLDKHINYNKSIFYHPSNEELNLKAKYINSYNDLQGFYKLDWLKRLRFKKIFLRGKKLDFFLLGYLCQDVIISETVKREFEKSKVTGIEYVKIDSVEFETNS